MSRIRALPPQVITAIAAGEIAERPAVILKELIENSLDAGATTISIDIQNSGLSSLSIADDGEGILAADLPLAIKRHTTSKISSLQDLEQIQTLGFRGEALASIASIAKLEITTRHAADSIGSQLIVHYDQLVSQQPIGRATGTTVTVTDMFAQLPARLKFLHHKTTEWRLVSDVVTSAAIGHPQIGFWLRHNHKVVLSLPAAQTLEQRLCSLFGESIANQLTLLNYHHPQLQLTGFLGKPLLARRSKDQYLFINRRPITSQTISRHIKYAYSSLLEARVEPFFVLNLSLSPGLVDVNVHPRKETARFVDEKRMHEIITEAVKQALFPTETEYVLSDYAAAPLLKLADSGQLPSANLNRSDRTQSLSTSQTLKQLVESWQLQPQIVGNIAQIHQTYLVAETPQGMIMIDQHAAHERILFEQYRTMYEQTVAQQPITTALPTPVVITLPLSDTTLLTEQAETLTALGFAFDMFGTTSFKLTHVPTTFADHDPVQTIRDLLDDLRDDRPLVGVDRATERTLAYLACRHAVKAGNFLTQEQRQELITKLSQTTNNQTCPHGRPVSVTYTVANLESLFKRH